MNGLRPTFALSSLAIAALLLVGGCGSNGGASNGPVAADKAPTPSENGPKGRTVAEAAGVDATGNEIKIGVVGSVTGDQKPWGEDSIRGAKLAADEFNAAGGFNGKKVVVAVEDSASKADGAKSAAEKLLSSGVVAIVGEVASGNTIQIAKAAWPKAIPVVAVGATRTDLNQEGGHVFRVCYTDDFQGPAMAQFAYQDLGLKSVGLVTDNKQPYSQGLSESFRKQFEKLGGKIVGEAFYESGQTDFQGIITQMKANNPDGLFMSGYFPEVGPMAQAIRAAGMKDVKLLGGDGWDSPQLLISGGDAIIGSYFFNHYNNREKRTEVSAFLDKWRKLTGGEPQTTMAALGYDAMKLTLDAIKRAGTPNSKAIIKALDETENFPGVSGLITLKGQNGNPIKQGLVVQVRPKSEGFQVFVKAIAPDKIEK